MEANTLLMVTAAGMTTYMAKVHTVTAILSIMVLIEVARLITTAPHRQINPIHPVISMGPMVEVDIRTMGTDRGRGMRHLPRIVDTTEADHNSRCAVEAEAMDLLLVKAGKILDMDPLDRVEVRSTFHLRMEATIPIHSATPDITSRHTQVRINFPASLQSLCSFISITSTTSSPLLLLPTLHPH